MVRLDVTLSIGDTDDVGAISVLVESVVGAECCESGFGFGERDLGWEFVSRADADQAAGRVSAAFASRLAHCAVTDEETIQ